MEVNPFELLTIIQALELDKEIMCSQDINRYHFISSLQDKLFKQYEVIKSNIVYPDNFQ